MSFYMRIVLISMQFVNAEKERINDKVMWQLINMGCNDWTNIDRAVGNGKAGVGAEGSIAIRMATSMSVRLLDRVMKVEDRVSVL